MDAEQLTTILEQHAKWLADDGGKRANLSGANLSVANLSKANLSEADLSWADLSGANLSVANLSKANLSRADLSRANLSGADLTEADLSEANLSVANLSKANLIEANLSRVDLSRADLSGANLSRVDLSWANLSGANLSEANLSRAKGLIEPSAYITEHFEATAEGIIAYKFQATKPLYNPNPSWVFEPGAILEEVVNPLPTVGCACGVNLATREWCEQTYKNDHGALWKCLIRWQWAPGIVVPHNTDGKIRCSKVELVEVVEKRGK